MLLWNSIWHLFLIFSLTDMGTFGSQPRAPDLVGSAVEELEDEEKEEEEEVEDGMHL